MKKLVHLMLLLALVGCSTFREESSPYERHMVPQRGYMGQQRGYYDHLLVNRAAYTQGRSYHKQLVDAVHGDAAAAHQLFHNEYRDDCGEYGETWSSHCYVLLLKLGDRRFAALLATEDELTRGRVGGAVNGLIDGFPDEFPMTKSLCEKGR